MWKVQEYKAHIESESIYYLKDSNLMQVYSAQVKKGQFDL